MSSVVIALLTPSAPYEEVDHAEIAASPTSIAGVCAPPPNPAGTPPHQPAPRNTPAATPVFLTARWRRTPYRRTLASAASSPKFPHCGSRRWS